MSTGSQVGMGALGGAGTGAAIGSVIPGVGTAIGAGIGGLLGGGLSLWQALDENKQIEMQNAADAATKAEQKRILALQTKLAPYLQRAPSQQVDYKTPRAEASPWVSAAKGALAGAPQGINAAYGLAQGQSQPTPGTTDPGQFMSQDNLKNTFWDQQYQAPELSFNRPDAAAWSLLPARRG